MAVQTKGVFNLLKLDLKKWDKSWVFDLEVWWSFYQLTETPPQSSRSIVSLLKSQDEPSAHPSCPVPNPVGWEPRVLC